MKITSADLLEVIYRYYPRGILHLDRVNTPSGEPVYMDTEEHCHLIAACARGRREYATWDQMLDRLRVMFLMQNDSLHLVSGNIDPAYSGRVWLVVGETSINFHVSLLGPYYGIQLPGVPDEEPVAREIAREIEATYPGYQTIPPEIGNEVVPDVSFNNSEFGGCTIYTLVFAYTWRQD